VQYATCSRAAGHRSSDARRAGEAEDIDPSLIVAAGAAESRSILAALARTCTAAMQRFLIVLGLAILAVGLLWPWLSRLPLGRLPGDFAYEREGLRVYFPFVTMLIVSVVVSFLLWLFRR
jgi:hypothetical protein